MRGRAPREPKSNGCEPALAPRCYPHHATPGLQTRPPRRPDGRGGATRSPRRLGEIRRSEPRPPLGGAALRNRASGGRQIIGRVSLATRSRTRTSSWLPGSSSIPALIIPSSRAASSVVPVHAERLLCPRPGPRPEPFQGAAVPVQIASSDRFGALRAELWHAGATGHDMACPRPRIAAPRPLEDDGDPAGRPPSPSSGRRRRPRPPPNGRHRPARRARHRRPKARRRPNPRSAHSDGSSSGRTVWQHSPVHASDRHLASCEHFGSAPNPTDKPRPDHNCSLDRAAGSVMFITEGRGSDGCLRRPQGGVMQGQRALLRCRASLSRLQGVSRPN